VSATLGLFGPCDECGQYHDQPDYLVCDDCAEPELRAWLEWCVPHEDTELILRALVARNLFAREAA